MKAQRQAAVPQQQAAHPREHEHEFEAAPGLPEPLPAGERVLWQGSPEWRALARDAFHLHKLAMYFALLIAVDAASVISRGGSIAEAVHAVLVPMVLALFGLGLVATLAWLSSRTAVYTVTDRRVVMRVGIVLSLTFNLPFKHISAANLRPRVGHTGDIALSLSGSDRIAILHLWPHARPWRFTRTEPMLRSVPDAARVAQLLSLAWADARGVALPAVARARREAPTLRPSSPTVDAGGAVASHG